MKKVLLVLVLGLIFGIKAWSAPLSWEALLTVPSPDYAKSLLLGDTLTFDYWFETSAAPGSYSGQTYDVVVLQTPGDWVYIGQVGAYYSHTDWQNAILSVPLVLRGTEREVRFHLADYPPATEPNVYLNNVGGAPVPEPGTLLLLGSGLLGLAACKRGKSK